jgi:putative transcriptional regulator
MSLSKRRIDASVESFDVQMSAEEARKRGKIDWEIIRKTTEADIERQRIEDDCPRLEDLGPGRVMFAGPNVEELRTKLGLTQEAFANRYGLALETLQEWERRRRQPDGTAPILLQVIEGSAKTVESVLKSET